MQTFYNDRTGELAYTEAKTGKIKTYPVKFLDYPLPSDQMPKRADLDYQSLYAEAATTILAKANQNSRHGFVLDNSRNDGFTGAGFMDGRWRVFIVREDKKGEVGFDGRRIIPSDAGYRFELDAYDDLDDWVFQGRAFVIAEGVRRLKEIDEKP